MPAGRTKASVPFPPRRPRPAANRRPESDAAAHASPATPPTAAKWRRKRAVRLPRGKRRASEAESTRIAANWHPEFDAGRGWGRKSRFRAGFTANRCKTPSGERLTVWLLAGIALPTLICSIPRRSAVRNTIQSLLSQLERAKPLSRSGWACGTSSGSEVSEGRITRALLFSWRWNNNPQGRVRQEGRTAGGEDTGRGGRREEEGFR